MKLVLKKTTIDIKFENFVETDITSQLVESAGYWYGSVGNPIQESTTSGKKYAPIDLSQYVGHNVFVSWQNSTTVGRFTSMCNASTYMVIGYRESEIAETGGKLIPITAEAPYLYLSTGVNATGLSVIVKD